MKKIITPVFLLLILIACQPKGESALQPNTTTQQDGLMSVAQIDAIIKAEILATNKPYSWSKASDEMIWSATQNSEKLLSIGYKPANIGNIDNIMHQIDINSTEWVAAKKAVLQMVFQEEHKGNPELKMEDIITYEDDILPFLSVKIQQLSVLKNLRHSAMVRYAEPSGYRLHVIDSEANTRITSGGIGCDVNYAETGLKTTADYTTITTATPKTNCKISWNYAYHGISPTLAWSKSTGKGIKMMIIDSGSSPDQENLGSAFNQGLSSGRTISRISTIDTGNWFKSPNGVLQSPDDLCGHGTSMMGVAVAPRGTDGNAVGIAYNASLVSCRAGESPHIFYPIEDKGVADAFKKAANDTSVKIISMSMGCITEVSSISDAIRLAYGKGKMIFCAGGTSFSWAAGWYGVIYPANLTEVIAVTGVKDNLTTRCDICHEGSKIDFTVVMEKASNKRWPLSLAQSGDVPSTVGGSSVATASMAGMAALVWSKYPTADRTTIFNKLKNAASNATSRHPNFGWGRVDVNKALL